MHQVTVEEAQDQLAQLMEEVGNDKQVIIKNNGFSVKLISFASEKRRPLLGTAEGQVWMADDFDAPLEDFKDYMWCACCWTRTLFFGLFGTIHSSTAC